MKLSFHDFFTIGKKSQWKFSIRNLGFGCSIRWAWQRSWNISIMNYLRVSLQLIGTLDRYIVVFSVIWPLTKSFSSPDTNCRCWNKNRGEIDFNHANLAHADFSKNQKEHVFLNSVSIKRVHLDTWKNHVELYSVGLSAL